MHSIPNQLKEVNSRDFENLTACILKEQHQISKACNTLSARNFSTRLEIYRKINLAKDYMKGIPNRAGPLDEVLAVVGLSKFHFSRQFKNLEGVSPSKFHLNYRLDLAYKALLNKKVSIKELSILYGFSDIHHFSKAF